jgi:hypothetical protein
MKPPGMREQEYSFLEQNKTTALEIKRFTLKNINTMERSYFD